MGVLSFKARLFSHETLFRSLSWLSSKTRNRPLNGACIAHNALSTPGLAVEPTTGEVHLRHHISPTGFYRGRKVLKTKSEA
jgi:large subunit ribosomal protein L32